MKRRSLLHNPLVMIVIGTLLGLFLGIGWGAGLLLVVSGEPKPFDSPQGAAEFDIEAVVEETYINRIMIDSANDMGGPYSLEAGQLDLKAGGIGDFTVKVKIGPLSPVVRGRVGFQPNESGSSIEVVLLDVQVGELQLASVLPNGLMDGANRDIERLMVDKIGAHGLKVIGLQTDENQLRLQFGRE
jgi:hypothetical protein